MRARVPRDGMTRLLPALLLPALPLPAGCAAPGTPQPGPVVAAPAACPPGTEGATVSEVYFGRTLRGRAEVSEAEWTAFLAEVVTPAFPDGLTALDGHGQWRNRAGRILRERSKVLVLVLPGQDAVTARARLLPAEEAWKRRFDQESVLTVHRAGCVSF
jgi:hypothetical protein